MSQDRGTVAVHDAAHLPGGGLLLALGEGGLRFVSPRGKTVTSMVRPCHRLVLSHAGTQALALARRGGTVLVSRVDLVRRAAGPVRELKLECWTPAYDGSVWFAGAGDELIMLDAMSDEPRTLWRLHNPDKQIWSVAHEDGRLTSLWADKDEAEIWRHDADRMRLQDRLQLPHPITSWHEPGMVAPCGAVCLTGPTLGGGRYGSMDPERLSKVHLTAGRVMDDGMCFDDRAPLCMDDSWLALCSGHETGNIELDLIRVNQRAAALTILLEDAQQVAARLTPGRLTVCDDLGRVLVYCLETGERLVDHRATV